MTKAQSRHTPSNAPLLISVFGLTCLLGAVLCLAMFSTPAHRAGGPILAPFISHLSDKILGPPESMRDNSEDELVRQAEGKARFIVRFRSNSIAERALLQYRENARKGREAFSDWSSASTELVGFRLIGVMPSGEGILVYEGSIDQTDGFNSLERLNWQLKETQDVVYSEPFQADPALS